MNDIQSTNKIGISIEELNASWRVKISFLSPWKPQQYLD